MGGGEALYSPSSCFFVSLCPWVVNYTRVSPLGETGWMEGFPPQGKLEPARVEYFPSPGRLPRKASLPHCLGSHKIVSPEGRPC